MPDSGDLPEESAEERKPAKPSVFPSSLATGAADNEGGEVPAVWQRCAEVRDPQVRLAEAGEHAVAGMIHADDSTTLRNVVLG